MVELFTPGIAGQAMPIDMDAIQSEGDKTASEALSDNIVRAINASKESAAGAGDVSPAEMAVVAKQKFADLFAKAISAYVINEFVNLVTTLSANGAVSRDIVNAYVEAKQKADTELSTALKAKSTTSA